MIALAIETPMNTATNTIVNLNKISSIPRLVLYDDSAAPNNAVPCPLTCMSITPTSTTDSTIISMLINVSINIQILIIT